MWMYNCVNDLHVFLEHRVPSLAFIQVREAHRAARLVGEVRFPILFGQFVLFRGLRAAFWTFPGCAQRSVRPLLIFSGSVLEDRAGFFSVFDVLPRQAVLTVAGCDVRVLKQQLETLP